jgi:inner membrane protein
MEKLWSWLSTSVSLKLVIITILGLFLLIPTVLIQELISERENRRQQAIAEVRSLWSDPQTVGGPILTIPFVREANLNGKLLEETHYYHFLPEDLQVSGSITPQALKRGIYEIIVYNANLEVKGRFSALDFPQDPQIKTIQWEAAFLSIGFSDTRGIKESIQFSWNDMLYEIEPGSKIKEVLPSGFTIPLQASEQDFSKGSPFSFQLVMQGSEHLQFIPSGKTTGIQLASSWPDPSFDGYFLPDRREVTEEGFSADWQIFQFNRNFPQQWEDGQFARDFRASSFGVNLLLPLDDYQKSMRSAKYALMTIALTFLVFFLVELLHKQKIHPFQYTLVGLALCLFYVLLVSISEHSNFNNAYLIASISIIGMISLYSTSIFKRKMVSALLLLVLVGVYSFVFVTLQLADYALLLGSIGLTIILALTMYFTRRVDWYGSEN